MAGRGPAPKDPSRRAHRIKPPVGTTVLEFQPGSQPDLPKRMPNGEAWPARTRAWWRMWRDSPLSGQFTANDWSELLDTAALHGAYWSGDLKQAAELRLRVAKFGATPEDRARLRIQFAQADEADAKRPTSSKPSERFADLRVLPSTG